MNASEDMVHNGTITKIERYKWSVQDAPGEFLFINKNLIDVSPEYQRNANELKIKAIAKAWSWIACGAIAVGKRDDKFYAIDGQHRVLASRRRSDIDALPCMVFKTSGIHEEALGFLNANTQRKPISATEKHKALTIVGDEVALKAKNLADLVGRDICSESRSGSIRCIRLLQKLISTDEECINRIWPLVNEVCFGHPLHERILGGMFYIEKHMPDGQSLAKGEWKKRVLKVGFDRLLGGANRAAAFFVKGGDKVWATGMVEELNHGLRNRLELL